MSNYERAISNLLCVQSAQGIKVARSLVRFEWYMRSRTEWYRRGRSYLLHIYSCRLVDYDFREAINITLVLI